MNNLERLRRLDVIAYNTWFGHLSRCGLCDASSLCYVGSTLYHEMVKMRGQLRLKESYYHSHHVPSEKSDE